MTKDELVAQLADAFRVAQNRTQVFDELAAERLGVNLTDLRCIDIVERLGRPAAGEVAREAGLTSGAMTVVLDRLERAGYLRRARDAHDRRVVRVELTELAHERVREIYGPVQESYGAHMRRYTNEQLGQILGFLRDGEEAGARLARELRERAP